MTRICWDVPLNSYRIIFETICSFKFIRYIFQNKQTQLLNAYWQWVYSEFCSSWYQLDSIPPSKECCNEVHSIWCLKLFSKPVKGCNSRWSLEATRRVPPHLQGGVGVQIFFNIIFSKIMDQHLVRTHKEQGLESLLFQSCFG